MENVKINTVEEERRLVESKGEDGMHARHEMRRGWLMTEAYRQAPNRSRMARCESMYDSEQWRHDEAEEVESRGQNAVVYNEIKPTIDWMIGTERRARVDFTVMAANEEEGADEDASNKTQLLKYLDVANNAAFERSWAVEDMLKAGVGWLEVGLRGDRSELPVYSGAESWRNILWDSQSRKRDLSDARYLFRVKVIDLDVAEAIFPQHVEKLRFCAQEGDTISELVDMLGGQGSITGLDDFSSIEDPLDQITAKPVDLYNTRRRVMLIECWSQEPQRRDGNVDGLTDPVTFKMRVSIMTEHDTLVEAWSPYKHNRFPFVPIWGYINRRTGLPYSPIWPLIGPQIALNHRMSKSLYEASANQLMIEKSAIDKEVMDVEEIREELNSPDGVAVFADGALSGNRVRPVEGQGRAEQQLMLADRDTMAIRSMGGVTGENRGERTNAVSGKAVLAKQDQGSLLTAELFDNMLLARKIEGETTLSMAEQYIVAPVTIPKMDAAPGDSRFLSLNQPSEDGSYLGDITQRQARFIVGEQQWKQAYAEAAFESLFTLFTQLAPAAPQVVVNLLDLIFDMHPNLPKKSEIVARMRSINEQEDPSGKLTPEQEQAKAEKERVAKQKFELEMRAALAEVAKKEADGEKITAQAMRERLTTLYEAAQAAQVLAQVPQTAPIADELARSVGFVDRAAPQGVIDMPQVSQQPAQPAAPLPELQQADGAMAGIQTQGADGVTSGVQ